MRVRYLYYWVTQKLPQIYCNFAYPYWEGSVICGNFWVPQFTPYCSGEYPDLVFLACRTRYLFHWIPTLPVTTYQLYVQGVVTHFIY